MVFISEPRPRSAGFDYPDIRHLDGVPWFEAPIPPRLHRCKVQTEGWIGFTCTQRCACGAIRMLPGRWWMERNSSRKVKDRPPVPATPYIERKQAELDQRAAIESQWGTK